MISQMVQELSHRQTDTHITETGTQDTLNHNRVTYKLSVMVYHCIHGTAPKYLCDLYTLVADVASRRQLRSASQNILLVPRYKRSGL